MKVPASTQSKVAPRGWILNTFMICLCMYGFISSLALLTRNDDKSTLFLKATSNDYEDQNQPKVYLNDGPSPELLTSLLRQKSDEISQLQNQLEQQEKQTNKYRFLMNEAKKRAEYSHRITRGKGNSQAVHNLTTPIDTKKQMQNEVLDLIPHNDLHLADYMADCWLMNKEKFMILKPPPEFAGAQTGMQPRMFVDWSNFAMEHMSNWWNQLNITDDPDPTIFRKTIEIYQDFLHQTPRSNILWSAYSNIHSHQGDSTMEQAIAMIAFQPITSAFLDGDETGTNRGDMLTAYSLATTIASLYLVGFGRTIVVGYGDEDQIGVEGAFRIIDSTFNKDQNKHIHWNETFVMKNKNELRYVRIWNNEWVYTRHIPVNVVRGSILGMQYAFRGQMNSKQTKEWLGNRRNVTDYWKYVFLAEPDAILHMKPWLLPSIRHQLDEGLVFYPHRIQPVPHLSNFPSIHTMSAMATSFLPKDIHPFNNISTIDHLFGQESCCDGGDELPGRTKEFGIGRFPCDGDWWWACGYQGQITINTLKNTTHIREAHKRLLDYPMMKFKDGSGLIWGSNERGRRCFPSKTPCK